jgi:hypothetical protein
VLHALDPDEDFVGSSLFGVGRNVVTPAVEGRACRPAGRLWP